MIIFQLARSYLTQIDAISSFSFLKLPCPKTHPVVVKKMSVCLRWVKSLIVSVRKNIKRLMKLTELGKELSNTLLKTGRIVGCHPVPEWWCIRVRREADEMMHPSCLVSTTLWGQYYDLGFLHLVRFSNIMWRKNEVS